MLVDTHCHLNFKRFKDRVEGVIQAAQKAGVSQIIVPGTDVVSSQKAVEIARKYEGIHAAVGIHPHHVYELHGGLIVNSLSQIEELISEPKVVAIGEVGIDRHVYENTKYEKYRVDETFIALQKELFQEQIKLAIKYKKSLIIHNREAKGDVTGILRKLWDPLLEGKTVFHCSEPDQELLDFAMEHKMYWGVDGDATYWKEKQDFIKKVPLSMLVLETDAPFLLPEPLKSQKLYPNEPKNVPVIAECIAQLLNQTVENVASATTENAKKLFSLESA